MVVSSCTGTTKSNGKKPVGEKDASYGKPTNGSITKPTTQ